MNIYEKMSAIALEVGVVAKNLEIDTGKGKGYKAVSEVDVLSKVKPVEAKYKIYSYPAQRNVIESGEFITEYSDRQGNKTQRKQLYLRIETVYRFVDMEKPTDFIEVTTYGDGLDSGDKATGKAMTYADKYALLKAYKIMTGDDPDQEASGDLIKTEVTGKQTIDAIKIEALKKKCAADGVQLTKLCKAFKVSDLSQLTEKQFANAVNGWEKVKETCC